MKRRVSLAAGAAAALTLASAFPTLRAAAQQKSLKEGIVGTWEIVALYDQYDDGRKIQTFGAGVAGRYVFGSDGSFTQAIIGEPRPEFKSNEPRRPDALVVMFLGRYTVDEAKNTVSYRIEHASNSARRGSEIIISVKLDGDTASLVSSPRKDQIGTFSPHVEVRRFK